jgi:hydrogenase 3 maturation protease
VKSPRKNPPDRLKQSLAKRLGDSRRIALVAIGSQFRGDDSCGLIVADALKKCKPVRRKLKVFIGATAPENITGEIKRFEPEHIILVDAADFEKQPGSVRLISPEEAQGVCFCTHQIPLQIMADYLTKSIGCCVTIIGIQAKTLGFGAAITPAVQKAALHLAKDLRSVLSCQK